MAHELFRSDSFIRKHLKSLHAVSPDTGRLSQDYSQNHVRFQSSNNFTKRSNESSNFKVFERFRFLQDKLIEKISEVVPEIEKKDKVPRLAKVTKSPEVLSARKELSEREAKIVSKQKKHIEKFGMPALMTSFRPTTDTLMKFAVARADNTSKLSKGKPTDEVTPERRNSILLTAGADVSARTHYHEDRTANEDQVCAAILIDLPKETSANMQTELGTPIPTRQLLEGSRCSGAGLDQEAFG